MTHPLENYRSIATTDFFVHVEEKFYTAYHDELMSGLYVTIEKENDRMKVMGVDLSGNSFEGYATLTSYLLSEYDRFEKEARAKIDDEIFNLLDEAKQIVFVNNILAELQVVQNAISNLSIDLRYDVYRKILVRESQRFIQLLQAIYKPEKQVEKPAKALINKKLQWMGKTNILTTLFYDLRNGVSSSNIPKLINATPKEIEVFIVNNFIDKEGNEFALNSTIKTNLKDSKQLTKRANDSIDLSSYFDLE